MMFLYLPGSSFLHRMSAGQKLLILCISSIVFLPVKSLALILLLVVVVVGLYVAIGVRLRCIFVSFKPLLPFLLIILLFHILAGNGGEGAVIVSRLLGLILLANLVSITTRMADMMAAMRPIFEPLRYLGVNPRKITVAVALMIRFAPVIFASYEKLQESWRARTSAKPRWRLLAPLTIQTLKLADSVGDALQSRGGACGLPPK